MMTKLHRLAPFAALAMVLAMPLAQAQDKKASSPFSGFSSDSGKPVDVKSDALEVHQNEQMAIFSGNVVATQGESVLHADQLTVYYDNSALNGGAGKGAAGDAAPAPAKKSDGGGQANAIKKLVAKGNVVVTSKDQRATGDDGLFDMASNTATLTGQEVVMVQGPNVLKGKKLTVDLNTGISHVTGGTTGLFSNSQGKDSQQ